MKKPTIVIVGLLPAQAHKVERECGRMAKLKFVDANKRHPTMMQGGGDHVILLLKFISHIWSEAAFRRWPRERVHQHRGGTSGVVDIVAAIAAAA